ncbi:MAG TPA: hypothetical protein VFD03_04295, partial [Clostridia bacterium]|nr:hypothetical protein [Clostridia bacterium]
MVKIGDIYLGGAEGSSTQLIFNSGIGFFLETDSKISNTLPFENGKWEVELKEGQRSIIARCTEVLPEDHILDLGFRYCQQAIDLLSVEFAEYLNIQETGNFHILLYKKDDEFFLKQVQTAFSTITARVEAVVSDTITGIIVPQPAPPEPKLTSGLRYYRLSQNANDLYEAYRNAFLSFEFLLNDIHPIRLKPNGKLDQGERGWFKEALKTINSKIKLIDLVPQGTVDSIEYLVISQYDNIRCKLFHAKGVAGQCQLNIIVPADTFNRKDVGDAYVELMILLKNILKEYYNIKFEETCVTYSGFKLMMENNLSNGCSLFINDDDSPING